jgi:hypothetical protein
MELFYNMKSNNIFIKKIKKYINKSKELLEDWSDEYLINLKIQYDYKISNIPPTIYHIITYDEIVKEKESKMYEYVIMKRWRNLRCMILYMTRVDPVVHTYNNNYLVFKELRKRCVYFETELKKECLSFSPKNKKYLSWIKKNIEDYKNRYVYDHIYVLGILNKKIKSNDLCVKIYSYIFCKKFM